MSKQTILVDVEQCVGCWTCAMACHVCHHCEEDEFWLNVETLGGLGIDEPVGDYETRRMGWRPVYSKKCMLCADLQVRGEEPYCVRNCPAEAIAIGNLEDEDSKVRKLYDLLLAKGRHVVEPLPWEDVRPEVIYMTKCE